MADKKFSQFVAGGNMRETDTVVGLRAGVNTKFNVLLKLPWTVVIGATQLISNNNAYISATVGGVTFTLPTIAAVGDEFIISGLGTAGWSIAQNTNQTIHFGNVVTTTTTGTLASTAARDSISMVCVVANTDWNVFSSIGNLTYT